MRRLSLIFLSGILFSQEGMAKNNYRTNRKQHLKTLNFQVNLQEIAGEVERSHIANRGRWLSSWREVHGRKQDSLIELIQFDHFLKICRCQNLLFCVSKKVLVCTVSVC